MFIIIPFIIVFLLYSYIALNDVSQTTEIIIYCSMVLVVLLSLFIAKKVKSDFRQQQINSINSEIYELNQKLKNSSPEQSLRINHKIEILQHDLMKLS